MLTNDMLVKTEPYMLGWVQRYYRLPNGYGLSAINSPSLHHYKFAWEFAVVKNMREDGRFDEIAYDTPLTDDVVVCFADREANAFVARAKAWAEANMAGTA